jgi:hypothetical protein
MLERIQAVSTNLDTPSATASIIWTIQNPQENPANSPNYGIDTSMPGILAGERFFGGQLGFWSGRRHQGDPIAQRSQREMPIREKGG